MTALVRYFPPSQLVHDVEDAPLYLPASQLEQAEDSSVAAVLERYLPAAQPEQLGELSSLENFPDSQFTQSWDTTIFVPAGQVVGGVHVPTSKFLSSPRSSDLSELRMAGLTQGSDGSKLAPCSGVPDQWSGQPD